MQPTPFLSSLSSPRATALPIPLTARTLFTAALAALAPLVLVFLIAFPGCSTPSPSTTVPESETAATPVDPGPETTPAEPASGETGDTATPGESDPGDKAPMSPDDCSAAGGTFVASKGGAVSCPDGQKRLGPVRFGIEGGLCCE